MSKEIRKREHFKLSLAVFLLLFDGDKVLLLLRSGTGWMDGQYTLPGGVMEEMETFEQAIHREVQEEIDCCVDINNLALFHMMHNFTTGEEWIGAFFVSHDWQGEPKINEPHKHGDLKWFPIDELPSNMNPYVKQAIKHYKQGKTHSLFGWEIPADSSEEDYLKYYDDDAFTGY